LKLDREEVKMLDADTSRASRISGTVGSRVRPRTGLILAGAAAKGPYAAGALAAIAADGGFDVRIVVGASSGALNAVIYAAGLRVDEAGEAARRLCELWREKANLFEILPERARKALVKDALNHFASKKPSLDEGVQARVIVTSLSGIKGKYGYVRAEHTFQFGAKELADPLAIPQIADACVASAAIPVLFAPVDLPATGPSWDGGIVNNTPLGWALKADPEIDHLIVITPEALADGPEPTRSAHGAAIAPELVSSAGYGRFAVGRLVEIVIEERLNRDLHEARGFNEEIRKLVGMGVSAEALRAKLNWRLLEIIEVRPERALEGGLLSGFSSPELRDQYIERGREAAKRALEAYRAHRDSSAAMSAV
jgi:NTE family protein